MRRVDDAARSPGLTTSIETPGAEPATAAAAASASGRPTMVTLLAKPRPTRLTATRRWLIVAA
jgi:hypothetical protein